MALSITFSALVLLVSTIPVLVAIIISTKGYIQRRYSEYFYMSITWIFLWCGNLLIGLSYLTLDLFIYRIGIVVTGPVLFGIIFLVDSVSRNNIDPRKILIATASSIALAIYSTEPDSVIFNTSALGELGPSLGGNFEIAGSITFLTAGLFWLYYMTLIHIRAPVHLKRYSLISMLGAIVAGPGSVIAFVTGIVWFLPGVDYLLIAIGALLTSYAFSRQPKLAYVLPFKVFRVIAFDVESGIPVFTYTWDSRGLGDSTLFTGALSGVISLLKESLGRGVIEHIAFQKGMLLIDYIPDKDIGFALIASKSNETLKLALRLFSEAFINEFEKVLEGDRSQVDQYSEAWRLIDKAFPFVVSVESASR